MGAGCRASNKDSAVPWANKVCSHRKQLGSDWNLVREKKKVREREREKEVNLGGAVPFEESSLSLQKYLDLTL